MNNEVFLIKFCVIIKIMIQNKITINIYEDEILTWRLRSACLCVYIKTFRKLSELTHDLLVQT